jgi:hypothetical protein
VHGSFAVLGRDRDTPALQTLGHVETLLQGPVLRARASHVNDRTFVLFRVIPVVEPPAILSRQSAAVAKNSW